MKNRGDFKNTELFSQCVEQGAAYKQSIKDINTQIEALSEVFKQAAPSFDKKDLKLLISYLLDSDKLSKLIEKVVILSILMEFVDESSLDLIFRAHGYQLKRIKRAPWEIEGTKIV